MTEQWRPVVGLEDRYEVSDQGRVARLGRIGNGPRGSWVRIAPKVLKPQVSGNGHLSVILTDALGARAYRRIHVLVLEAFVGPRPEGLVGCHGPGGKLDNSLTNLRWDTQKNNIRDTLADGTHPSGAGLEHCSQGHEFTPENTYWHRGCKTCEAARTRTRKEKEIGRRSLRSANANAPA